MKAKWKVFEQIEVDVKFLDDIPEYWPYMKRYNLPTFQYTARREKVIKNSCCGPKSVERIPDRTQSGRRRCDKIASRRNAGGTNEWR